MWQAMLMSAGLPTSKQIFIEGFVTGEGGIKMSKSLGNVIDPIEYVEKYGTDAVRYYILAKFSSYEDSPISQKMFEEVYNSDLANGLGNVVSRVSTLAEKSGLEFEKTVFPDSPRGLYRDALWQALMDYRFDAALQNIWVTDLGVIDKELNHEAPWLIKDKDKLQRVLQKEIDDLRKLAKKIEPFLPETAEKILLTFAGPTIKKSEILFPRLK